MSDGVREAEQPEEPHEPVETAADEEVDEVEEVDDRADEIDGVRIRQLAAMRRGAVRARSYALIVTVICLVGAIKLGLMTVEFVRVRGWGPWPIGYVLFAIAALLVAAHMGRRVRELTQELKTPAPLPPTPPGGPDFSTLSDGSQQWKNLDEIR